MILLNPDFRPERPQFTIAPVEFQTKIVSKEKHAAEPIKKKEDIAKISSYLISKGKLRDNLLFVMGCNMGLRCSDLLKFQVGHLVDKNGNFREGLTMAEQKTEKTGKVRRIFYNEAVYKAAEAYLTGRELDPNEFLFASLSNNNTQRYYDVISQKKRQSGEDYHINGGVNTQLSVRSVERILKSVINDELHLNIHSSTHCLRKTFAYQTIVSYPDRDRALEILQLMFNHSSPRITLAYAGITDDEIEGIYKGLNLGINPCKMELLPYNSNKEVDISA